ncbi:MAG: GNAT family N-acetyltransferase [DPANN group archaeon]|nr:GNAT family N-acetyltransferase [DPANN group archaeon]
MNLQVINPLDYRDWDEMLLSTHGYSFFHTSHWARVLHESYGYRPLYFSVIKGGSLHFCLPFMEIRSRLTGKRGVSLPFTDYCDPVSDGGLHFQDMIGCLTEYGRRSGWKFIEMRGGGEVVFKTVHPYSKYYGHTLGLAEDEDGIYSLFRSSTQRNIRRAEREGVRVSVFGTLEAVREFYRLNCLTRRMHGLPPQPYFFFRKIFEHIISRNHGMVILARYKGQAVAGAVFFHFGKKAVYKYGASDKRYQHLRANNLVMWRAIREYCSRGYKRFCFGRTETGNRGLRQFKNGWGASEEIIRYYRYDCRRGSFVIGDPHVPEFHNKVLNKMPVSVLRMIGSVLYKHVG